MHHTHNNPTLGVGEQFTRMTPSRAKHSVAHSSAAGGRNSGPSTLDLITLQGQPSSHRSIFAAPGTHQQQPVAPQGPSFHPSKPETEDEHDSFNSDNLQQIPEA